MKLGVLCSGNGTNFENIVRNPICNKHEVVIMIHNKKKCGAAKRAEKWGIPHCYIDHKDEDHIIQKSDFDVSGTLKISSGKKNHAVLYF